MTRAFTLFGVKIGLHGVAVAGGAGFGAGERRRRPRKALSRLGGVGVSRANPWVWRANAINVKFGVDRIQHPPYMPVHRRGAGGFAGPPDGRQL